MSHIVIDSNKCKSCYLCINACPLGLIKKGQNIGKTGEYTVEFSDIEKKCFGCAQCAMACPDVAIVEVIKDDK